MSIKLFFHISKDFFDQIYSPHSEYDEDITIIGDVETGFEELIEQTREEFCFYNLFLMIRQILSVLELKKQIKNE